MKWTTFSSGDYQNTTLPLLLFKDADYFFGAAEVGAFDGLPSEEVRMIHSRATSVRIPSRFPDHIAQYVIHRPTGSFQELNLIPIDDHRYQHALYREVIDFRVPRQLKSRDRTGYRLFVKNLKFYLFEDESIKLSKQRCESFFSDDTNFVLPQ